MAGGTAESDNHSGALFLCGWCRVWEENWVISLVLLYAVCCVCFDIMWIGFSERVTRFASSTKRLVLWVLEWVFGNWISIQRVGVMIWQVMGEENSLVWTKGIRIEYHQVLFACFSNCVFIFDSIVFQFHFVLVGMHSISLVITTSESPCFSQNGECRLKQPTSLFGNALNGETQIHIWSKRLCSQFAFVKETALRCGDQKGWV